MVTIILNGVSGTVSSLPQGKLWNETRKDESVRE